MVVDVETAGFNPNTDALLEVAAAIILMDEQGKLYAEPAYNAHVIPFEGAILNPKALAFNGIDPYHPFRNALAEHKALEGMFKPIRRAIKDTGCTRAILVGHNASFDLSFINIAASRSGVKRNPFHPFSTLDTVSLAALAFGQTVLAKAVTAAGMEWDERQAHSALYDTEKTAELFCRIVNGSIYMPAATSQPTSDF